MKRGSEGEGRHVTETGGLFGGRILGFQGDLETAVGVGSAARCCGYHLCTEAFRSVSLTLLIFTLVLCSCHAITLVVDPKICYRHICADGASDGRGNHGWRHRSSFNSSTNVELLKLDFASTDLDMPVLCSTVVPERFNRLSWSNIGAGTVEEFPLGVIAGGLRMARFISGTLINSSGRRLGHICNHALAACDCDSLVGACLGCQHWRRSPTLTA